MLRRMLLATAVTGIVAIAAIADPGNAASPAAAPSPVSVRVNGKLYEELEFISTTGEGVTFESKQGPLMAKWKDLPANIQKRFAKDYDESLREQQASVMTAFAVARFSGPVVHKLPHGIIALWGSMLVMLTDYPNEARLVTGQTITVNAQRTGSYPYTDEGGKTKILRRFKVMSVQ